MGFSSLNPSPSQSEVDLDWARTGLAHEHPYLLEQCITRTPQAWIVIIRRLSKVARFISPKKKKLKQGRSCTPVEKTLIKLFPMSQEAINVINRARVLSTNDLVSDI